MQNRGSAYIWYKRGYKAGKGRDPIEGPPLGPYAEHLRREFLEIWESEDHD